MPSVYDFDIDPEEYPGMLMVVFDITAEEIIAIDDVNDLVTTLAIQVEVDYQGQSTTVTSDYAAVYRSILKVFKLALNDKTEVGHNGGLNQRHLYGADASTYDVDSLGANYRSNYTDNDLSGHAQVAIDSEYDYTLLYNNKSGLDLKELVTVHYKEQLDKESSPLLAEQIIDSKTLAAYGLELSFEKSDYYLGTNLTNQSDFYTLNNGVVTVTLYDVDPVNGGKATIGREPLVRVELRDTENNKVVNTGWVKILIVEDDPKGFEVEFERPEFIVNCTVPVEFVTTVQEMNVDIYEEANMSKDQFHAAYTLNTVDGTDNAILVNSTDLGTVTQIYDDANNETVLLRWEITPAEMDIALARTGAAKGVLEATVTYTGVGREDVVITFTTKVTEPVATIDNHNSTYWNAALDVVYINAEIPGSQSNLDDFWTDQDWFFKVPTGEAFSRPNFNITPASALTDYPADYVWNYNNNNLQYFFQFKDGYTATETVGATNYQISVNNTVVNRNATAPNQSYSYLLATLGTETQIVATIDTYTGIIEYYNGEGTVTGGGQNLGFDLNTNITPVSLTIPTFVTNANNSFAQLLLNRVAALQSGMMSAEVEIILYNSCRDIEVTNGIFTAYFFRPVNVTAGTGNDFSDSDTSIDIDLTKLAILTDWREAYNTMWSNGSSFINTSIPANSQIWNNRSYETFFKYYDVTSIAVDIDGITTTMGGGTLGETLLSETNSELGVENVVTSIVQEPLADVNYGVFRYSNSGGKIQSAFQMRLPVVVTYKWGQVTVDVDVTVTP
ncbi:MAG: hypothetical protein LUD68_07870 [Rikenellaceae bacterium]|nr:hypothetical protein [Rikenellaceae bacterium]